MWHSYSGLSGGRYRRYLSLREGSKTGQIGSADTAAYDLIQALYSPLLCFSV